MLLQGTRESLKKLPELTGGEKDDRMIVCACVKRLEQSGDVHANIEGCGISCAVCFNLEHQLIPAVLVNSIVAVALAASTPARVRCSLKHLVGQGVIEEELRCEFMRDLLARDQPDLEMNVNRAARIPTWVNRQELRDSFCIRDLRAAQEFLSDRVVGAFIRILARGVAMPNIDNRFAQWCAGFTDR